MEDWLGIDDAIGWLQGAYGLPRALAEAWLAGAVEAGELPTRDTVARIVPGPDGMPVAQAIRPTLTVLGIGHELQVDAEALRWHAARRASAESIPARDGAQVSASPPPARPRPPRRRAVSNRAVVKAVVEAVEAARRGGRHPNIDTVVATVKTNLPGASRHRVREIYRNLPGVVGRRGRPQKSSVTIAPKTTEIAS